MSRFRATFRNRHVILPIIHTVDAAQAERNVHLAREGGADGVFLISHGRVADVELLHIHRHLTDVIPDFWLGVNCLSFPVEEMFRQVGNQVAGVWVDDALIEEAAGEQTAARQVLEVQRQHGWQGLYFGGVAFKYQRAVKNPGRTAALSAPFMDVVTTSGPGTGQAAPPSKVRQMKQAIGDTPLALASGVTPENVNDYLPYADCFLVATGISYTFEEIDPGRLRDLVRVVRAWRDG